MLLIAGGPFVPGDVQHLSVDVFLVSLRAFRTSGFGLAVTLALRSAPFARSLARSLARSDVTGTRFAASAKRTCRSSVRNVCLNEVRLPCGARKFSGSCRTICNESFQPECWKYISLRTCGRFRCAGFSPPRADCGTTTGRIRATGEFLRFTPAFV